MNQTAEQHASEMTDLDLELVAAGKGDNFAYRGPVVGAYNGPNSSGLRIGRTAYYNGANVNAFRGPRGRVYVGS